MAVPPDEITQLLRELKGGHQASAERLFSLIYQELHRLARGRMRRERGNHTLQPTALVHEAYIRLIRQRNVQWQNRAHFIAVAAQLMRRILMDYARKHHAVRHGGDLQAITLEEGTLVFSPERSKGFIDLDEALTRLAAISGRQGRIVELRFFGGLTVEETAEVLGVAPRTIKRDWNLARAWLHRELVKDGEQKQSATGHEPV